jgi:hypothetical protein
VTPFIHPAQPMSNPSNTNSITTTTNNQPQAAGINVSKIFGGMGSTIVDRSAFRQQPPPMKVNIHQRKLISKTFFSF